MRENTTAEIAIQTDHITVLPVPPGDWGDKMSYEYLPSYAKLYGCYMMDQRTLWKEYLETNHFEPKKFLRDGVHLNPDGCWLMSSIVDSFLVYRPDLPDTDWKNLARDYAVGKDVTVEGRQADARVHRQPRGRLLGLDRDGRGAGRTPERQRCLLTARSPPSSPPSTTTPAPSGTPSVAGRPSSASPGRSPWSGTWTAKCQLQRRREDVQVRDQRLRHRPRRLGRQHRKVDVSVRPRDH